MKSLILMLMLMSVGSAGATSLEIITRTAAGYQVSPIHIKGLNAYAGRALHVFYVSGREATLAVSGQTLKVRALGREPIRVEISATGEADVPQTLVPFGRFLSFNYILFEVTSPEITQAFLRNADGTYPSDPRARDSDMELLPERDFRTDRTGFVSVSRLMQMSLSIDPDAGSRNFVTLEANRDF